MYSRYKNENGKCNSVTKAFSPIDPIMFNGKEKLKLAFTPLKSILATALYRNMGFYGTYTLWCYRLQDQTTIYIYELILRIRKLER